MCFLLPDLIREYSELAMPATKVTTPKKSKAGPAGQPPVVAVASAFAGSSSPPVELVSPRRRKFRAKKCTREFNSSKGHEEKTSNEGKSEKEEVIETRARTRKEEEIMKNDLDHGTMSGSVYDSDSATDDEKFHDSSTSLLSCSSCEEEEEMEREESIKIDGSSRKNGPIQPSPLRRAVGMFTKKHRKRHNKVSPLFKQSQMQPNYPKVEGGAVEDSSEDSSNEKMYVQHNTKRRSYNRRRRITLNPDEDITGQVHSHGISNTTNAFLSKMLAEMEKEINILQKDNQDLRAKEMNNNKMMALPEPLELHSDLGKKLSAIELVVPRILCDGGYLWKIPFHRSGPPKRRWIQVLPAGGLETGPSGHFIPSSGLHSSHTPNSSSLNCDDNHRRNSNLGEFVTMMAASPVTLIWFDPRCPFHSSPPREMAVCDIEAVLGGHKAMAFWQQTIHRGSGALPALSLCFSLVGKDRTLDLHTKTSAQARQWREAFMFLASEHQLQNEEVQHYRRRQSWDISRENFERGQRLFPGVHSARNSRGSYSSIHSNDDYPETKRREHHRSSSTMSLHYPVDVNWSKGVLREWKKRLLSSSRQGDTHDVISLLEGGCPPDALDHRNGDTALSVACQLGHIRIVELLLSAGAKNDPNPGFGVTALQAAVGSSQHLCALALLNQEHAVSGQNDVATTIVNYLDRHGKSPLNEAAALNDSEMVNILLSYGADVHALDRHSKTLSWMALHHAAKEGAVMAMSSLLEVCGAEEIIDMPDEEGNCPLHIAVAFNRSEATLLLLQTAADPNPVNASGISPYSLAVEKGYMDIAQMPLDYFPNNDGHAGTRKVKLLAAPEVVQQNLLPSEHLPRPVVVPSSLPLRESSSEEIRALTDNLSIVVPEDEVVSPHDSEGRVVPVLDMETSKQLQESDQANNNFHSSAVGTNAMRAEEDTTGADSIRKSSLLNREQGVHSDGSDDSNSEASITEVAASPENMNGDHHSATDSEECFSPWQPTEKFETEDGNWSSFFSPEGYPYFVLESPNRQTHSQWEDPRLKYVIPSVEEDEEQCVDVPEENTDIPTEVFPLECNSLLVPAIEPLLLLPPPQSPPGNDKQVKTPPPASPLPPIHDTPKSPKTCAEMEGSAESPTTTTATLQNAAV